MITVGVDAAEVERRLASGRLLCPGCSARLTGWGHARRCVVWRVRCGLGRGGRGVPVAR